MITFALFSALSTFYFTMFFTPGPNNAMLTASGMKFGFVRTLPHLIGIPLGHILQIGLTCFGLANLFLLYPQVQFYMKILCFLYLIYLGWKMIGSFSMVQKETGRPLRFYEASLFQFINPKGVVTAIIVVSQFIDTGKNFIQDTIIVFTLTLTSAFLSISTWAIFGKYLRSLLSSKLSISLFNYSMASLLVLIVVLFWIK